MHNDRELEMKIQQCLESEHKQSVIYVQCHTTIGIGIVKNIEKMIIDASNNTTVSFTDQLELTSYVVIQAKDDKDLPSIEDLSRRWAELHPDHPPPEFEKLSAQFPNIFRVVMHSLDELLACMSTTAFKMGDHIATVFFRGNCCFLEDLPRTTNLDRLRDAILRDIDDKQVPSDSIHVEYNKDAANAVVLTSNRARAWRSRNSLTLDGRPIMKKDGLACRLIQDVPKDISSSAIENHETFERAVIRSTRSNNHVILELSDREVDEKCIERAAESIGGKGLIIDFYTSTSNPEDSDIDAENWYETEMCDHKSDIMPFMANPQHPIFRFKWNARAFLEQFQRWASTERQAREKGRDTNEKKSNTQRHLLRMTVMLNTIGVVKKGSYRVGGKEIKLKPGRLKTIHYDHKSKLERGATLSASRAIEFSFPSTSVYVLNEDCLVTYQNLVSKGYRPVVLNMANKDSPGGGYRRGDGAQEETLFRRSNYYQSLDVDLDDGKPSARFYCDSNCNLQPLTNQHHMYPMDEFGAIYTSGLTVFRHAEAVGYSFMDEPMFDVSAIAMAAYRDPKLDDKNFLADRYSIGTRKKIENIFAIAHHHKHDALVLSALGCGAFKNPPEHVAALFKSVIEQFAGYFKSIYFAIIDDHNAGQDLNPEGNYRLLQHLLHKITVKPKAHQTINVVRSDVWVSDSTS